MRASGRKRGQRFIGDINEEVCEVQEEWMKEKLERSNMSGLVMDFI